MKLRQLSLFLENQPGALSRPIGLLAKKKINLQTVCVADTQQFGILRLIVREWEQAKACLEKEGCVVRVTDVVAIEVADHPGGLAEILPVVEKAKVNVEYMYVAPSLRKDKCVLIFRFDDPDRAIEALRKAKISLVGPVELSEGPAA